jgi:predicted Ser/Thr protein kinase
MPKRIEDVSTPSPRPSQTDPYGFTGTRLAGRYQIEELLGMGGMAVVYRGKHLTTARTVAIKILKPDLAYSDNGMIKAFLNEAQATASLNHRNIIQVSDADRDEDGTTFLVMQYLKGKPLDEVIAEGAPLPLERVAGLFEQICDGVEHAHTNGIIHRDLKPGNIMILAGAHGEETAVILDFGIAKALTSTASVTRPVGTIYYASPEQWNKGSSIDHRSDIYSLGVLLYQMLTGAVPFDGDSIEHIIYQKLHFQPPPLRPLRPDVPAPVEEVIQRALAKEPTHRFGRATELSRALRHAVHLETGALEVECLDAVTRTPLAGASVLLNGRLAGQTDIAGFWKQANVAPRQYLLEVELPRYQCWRVSFQVNPREEAVVLVEMQREPKGELVIACGISGAEIEVDGRQVGKSDKTGRLFLDAIEQGTHTVRVLHSNFLPSETEATISIGEVSHHGVKLQPKPMPKTWKWLLPAALGGLLLAAVIWEKGLIWPTTKPGPKSTSSPSVSPTATLTPSPSPNSMTNAGTPSTPTPAISPTPLPTVRRSPTPTPTVRYSPTPTPVTIVYTGNLNDLRPTCPIIVWPESINRPKTDLIIYLQMTVSDKGAVTEVGVQSVSGKVAGKTLLAPDMEAAIGVAARDYALGCKFKPPFQDGRPVNLKGRYYITFAKK